MNSAKFIMLGMVVGSTIGSYLPVLWGDSVFSYSSVILAFVGGIFGIWLAYRLTH